MSTIPDFQFPFFSGRYRFLEDQEALSPDRKEWSWLRTINGSVAAPLISVTICRSIFFRERERKRERERERKRKREKERDRSRDIHIEI